MVRSPRRVPSRLATFIVLAVGLCGRRDNDADRADATVSKAAGTAAVAATGAAAFGQPWRATRGHGADHVLPLLVSASLIVPVIGGRLALGTWQSIALVDPNPDNSDRRVRLSFVPG